MEGTYPLLFGNERAGQVQISREGLYCCFSCRCRLPEKGIYRVQMLLSGRRENLGILVPEGDAFVLKTRLPAKRLGEEMPEFLLTSNCPVTEGKFVPIKPEEPFAYLERLKEAYLARQNGQIGACFREMQE